jgi:hypothetical protein
MRGRVPRSVERKVSKRRYYVTPRDDRNVL